MSKNWKPNQGFPSPEQVERMVAAEVKHLAETEYARNRGVEEKRQSRRDRLRTAYRLQRKPVGCRVNLDAIFSLVGNVASVTFAAWRGLFALDMVALADAGNREDFDDMEFLVTRALGELNGIKNLLALARRLAYRRLIHRRAVAIPVRAPFRAAKPPGDRPFSPSKNNLHKSSQGPLLSVKHHSVCM